MNKEEFVIELKKIGIFLDDSQLKKLEEYYNILIEKNKVLNLTRIVDQKDVYLKHFYDSLTISKIIDLNNQTNLCDVGSGAGFPGIVLKIVYPNLNIVLVDSLRKRVDFLNEVIEKLKLKNIVAIHSRIEDYSKNNKEKYDIVVSRAVARSEILIELCSQAVKINGHLLFMKGIYTEEFQQTKKIISKYKLKLNKIIEFNLPIENSKRTLVDFIKIDKTPNIYPRRINIIEKENLNKNVL